jgi:hypothetical protein
MGVWSRKEEKVKQVWDLRTMESSFQLPSFKSKLYFTFSTVIYPITPAFLHT